MVSSQTNGTAVRAEGLTKTYGEGEASVHALKSVDVTVPSGEFVVLLGPSGSGKTTLLNQVGALEEPSAGTLEVAGRDLSSLDEKGRSEYRRESIGFVFQFYNLVPTLTALENVALIAELTGSNAEAAAADVLERVGLGDRMDHFPGQMSGGEQQRVSIARGLVKDPPLMLCDEPTGALDVETGRSILSLLQGVTRKHQRTVLLVTHNTTIAEMADRVIRLRDGEVIGNDANVSPSPAEDLDW